MFHLIDAIMKMSDEELKNMIEKFTGAGHPHAEDIVLTCKRELELRIKN